MTSPKQWDKKVILLKPEVTYGVDAVPTGAANAILALNVTFDPNPQTALERKPLRPFLGNVRRPIAGRHVALQFDVEIASAGAAGTAPKYGPALRASGWAETINVAVDVQYDPVSGGYESATSYFDMDGDEHKIPGLRGNVALVYAAGEVPVYRHSFLGLQVDPSEVALPAADFSGFREPVPVDPANTPTFTLDGFAARLQSLTVDLQQRSVFRQRVNSESVDITGREPTGSVVIEAPDLTDKDYFAIAKGQGNGTTPLSVLQLVHGTVAGDIVQLDLPAVQLINPRYREIEGITHLEMDLNPTPTAAGDDEIKITVK